MPQPPLPRRLFAKTLGGIAIMEWLLLELLRTPYNPPHDMSTLLGTEKYGVIVLMLALALPGLIVTLRWASKSTWSRSDYVVISTLAIVLLSTGGFVVFDPWWPVTPFHLLLD